MRHLRHFMCGRVAAAPGDTARLHTDTCRLPSHHAAVHAIKQLFALRRWEHCFTILEEDEGVRTVSYLAAMPSGLQSHSEGLA